MDIKKFLSEKKKFVIIVGIGLLVIICLLVLILILGNPYRGKEKLEGVYFDKPEGVNEVTKDDGVIGSDMKWKTVKYSADDIIYMVTHYENRSVEEGVLRSEKLEPKTINGVQYYYKTVNFDKDHSMSRYYTQVGEDTYYVSVVYKTTNDNQKKIDDFVDSIVFRK